jgi:dTDP-4-dehydrorhamnose reductase
LKVLVIGSNGQLGQCIKNATIQSSIDIDFFLRKDFNFLDCNSSSERIDLINPDIIINAAAFTNVDLAEEQRIIANKVNNLGLEFLASKCKKLNSHLIHISTDYIFDGLRDTPYSEDILPNPINIYGQTKYDGELKIQESGCKFSILRSSWVFSEHGSNFLKTIIKLSQTKDQLTVIDDQIGSPTYAHDIAGIISEILFSSCIKQYEQEIFHVSGSNQMSWFEFASEILAVSESVGIPVTSKLVPISSESFNQNATRPKYSALSNKKVSQRFNYQITPLKVAILNSIKASNLKIGSN